MSKLVALALLLSLALTALAWALRGKPKTVVIQPPPSSQVYKSRCPKGTLDDNRVCTPVPRVLPTSTALGIPLLPGRPTSPTEYELPLGGEARFRPLNEAGCPESLCQQGRGLVIVPPEAGEVRFTGIGDTRAEAKVIALSRSEGWILLHAKGGDSDSGHLLLYSGLSSLTSGLLPSSKLNRGDLLGNSSRLVLAAGKLLPKAPEPKTERSFSDDALPTDLRNVLPLRRSPTKQ